MSQLHLLLDPETVEEARDVQVVAEEARRAAGNPLIRIDQPWERDALFGFPSVLYDAEDRLFKAWYTLLFYDLKVNRRIGSALAYATSADGLAWEKPKLGLIDYAGDRSNNLLFPVLRSFHARVIKDPTEIHERRRYKMLFYFRTAEMAFAGMFTPINVAYSPDGIRWSMPRWTNPVIPSGTDALAVYWDPARRRYVALLRPERNVPRLVCISESDDFVHWSPRRTVLAPDEDDGPWGREFYGMVAMRYEDCHVGLLEVYHTLHEGWTAHHELRADAPAELETIDIQLAYSRDGCRWHRPRPRRPLLPVGAEGSWDAGMVFPAQAPIVRGDEIWVYYNGFGERHYAAHRAGYRLQPQRSGCGLAKLRKHRWLGAAASHGVLTTRILDVLPREVRLNANASAGAVRVEVVNPFGEPVRGYTRDECDPVQNDGLSQRVTWRDRSALDTIRDEILGGYRLRFHIDDASLYSFDLVSDE